MSNDGDLINVKKNLPVFLILTFVIIACASISYYFVYFLPSYKNERELHTRILECRKLAIDRHNKNIKENEDNQKLFSGTTSYNDMVWSSMEYEAHYNSKLKKCIYCEVDFHALGNPIQSSRIYDLYSNPPLMSFDVPQDSPNMDREFKNRLDDMRIGYEKSRRELFEE